MFALHSPPTLAGVLLSRLGLVLALCLAPLMALAEDEKDDPPARAGRVAEVSGEAWMFDTEVKEWTRVERNQTIGEGDRLRTEAGGRVSLRIGSTSLWLDEASDLEFHRLDDSRVELDLDKGSLALRLRSREAVNDYQLRTREGRFTPEREGLYRIDQMDRGSRGLNWEGMLRFDSRADEAAPVWIQPGEQAELWWANGPRTERQNLARDEFADWLLAQRESEGQHLQAYRYVSPEMTGAEDLDRHGRWEQSPEYGPLWTPTAVAVDWAPYRHGRWSWSARWGWTWVDEAPWGFAPFHYGRWVRWGGRWCWAPGPYVARPVYAPALVAWVGGPALSVGIHLGGGHRPPPPRYGWVPLAPREAYMPGYRHSRSYWQRVNRDHDPITVVRPGPGRPDWRPDRPHRNQDAISALPLQGGRPQPFRPVDTGPLQPLAQAPGRGDMPQAQPREPRPQPVFETPRRRERPNWDPAERGERPERTERPAWQARPVLPARPSEDIQPLPQWPRERGERPERGERVERNEREWRGQGWPERARDAGEARSLPQIQPQQPPQSQAEPRPWRGGGERGGEAQRVGPPAPPAMPQLPRAQTPEPPRAQPPSPQPPRGRENGNEGPQRHRGEWSSRRGAEAAR